MAQVVGLIGRQFRPLAASTMRYESLAPTFGFATQGVVARSFLAAACDFAEGAARALLGLFCALASAKGSTAATKEQTANPHRIAAKRLREGVISKTPQAGILIIPPNQEVISGS